MEEANLDWEMEEVEYEEMSGGGGKVSWILNKGLVFGKKVLMTGMLITSAPFVLPPLMAISAFGVAASVPSGLFLASYACTEKVMSSLLPGSSPPNSPFLLPSYYFEEGGGDINVGLSEQDDIDMEKEEQKQIDDTTARLPDQQQLVHPSDDEALIKKETMSGDANSNLAPNDDQLLQEIKIETAHEKAANYDDEFGRPVQVVEMESGGHEMSSSIEETTEKFFGSKHAEEMDMPIEAKSSAAAAAKKSGGKKKGKKKGKLNEIPQIIRNDSAKRDDDDSVVKVVDEATASSPPTHQHHQGKVVQTGDNNNGSAKAAGTRKKIHHSGRLTTDQEIRSPAAAGPKKEQGYSEEEDIRKQIEAMKTIVGYKGTPKPHASCLEELKALYIFTGVVEPPPPPPLEMESFSDIEELSHKLKFLMSIVGVK